MRIIKRCIFLTVAWAVTSIGAASALPHIVSRSDLCVTEGSIDAGPAASFTVDSPKMRAYVNVKTAQSIEARFTYLGPTSHDIPLASGAMRRQFGFKLRAQDACNLVYAMWRIEPDSKLVVSIKENPGQHSSAECGNRGYRNIKPQRSSPIPKLRLGDMHTVRAEMTATGLNVYIDEILAWQGSLGSDVQKWEPRVGIRSDNARARFDLHTGALERKDVDRQSCKSEPADAE
jgi:hypothetical protein